MVYNVIIIYKELGENMRKTGKIITGIVVGVLATTAIICVAVPRVRESIKDAIKKLKQDEGKTNDKSDKEKAQQKAHNDDHYQNLTDDEKKDFDNKLNDIVDSDYYKDLDEKGKDELLDKFVESEKVQQELKNDAEDKKPEEFDAKIDNKQNELDQVKKELEDLKNSGASEEEIAKAEEKQQEVEKEIKSAEQEKAYWETVETVKESVPTNELFASQYSNIQVRKINSIFADAMSVYINADLIMDEIIDGKVYKSQQNTYLAFDMQDIIESTSYSDILQMIKGTNLIFSDSVCVNKNSQNHKDYFMNNKNSISSKFSKLESQGYTFEIQDSWENESSDKPNFLIKADNGKNEKYIYVKYDSFDNSYSAKYIKKICPEFWAQLEIERAQTATTSAEAKAQAMIESNSTRDANGKVTGMAWGSIQTQREEEKAEREARLAMADTSSNVNVLYSDQGLSL